MKVKRIPTLYYAIIFYSCIIVPSFELIVYNHSIFIKETYLFFMSAYINIHTIYYIQKGNPENESRPLGVFSPFGFGARKCVGYRFAELELLMVVISLF